MRGFIATLLLVGLASNGAFAEPGSCAASGKCCPGRDSSCLVKGLQPNGQYVDRTCYCDESCLETHDCCGDYKDACGKRVVDCEVSSWGLWSSCDASCGLGKQTRKRVIVTHPTAGGALCGPLEQKKTCMGSRCSASYYKYKSPIRETAGLLPAKFYKNRPKKSWDVRDNLFQHTKQLQQKKNQALSTNNIDGFQADQPLAGDTETDYCIVFELVRVTKACRRDKDFFKLQKGQRTCALCPADARRKNLGNRCKGHGVDSQLTKWRSSVSTRCHGKWRRISEMGQCPCSNGPDVIFI